MDEIIILADGEFPTHEIPSGKLQNASMIVCCDGAAAKLLSCDITPDFIVGDMDSLDLSLREKYSNIIIQSDCQETNDLTKAFNHSLLLNPSRIIILGATGLREDHTLGNISLLSDYSLLSSVSVELWTNSGRFIPVNSGGIFYAAKGSQVSIFALDCNLKIESKGLKYPLDDVVFDNWWRGTLNECLNESFELIFDKGRVLLFITY
jgi:thiamine pyrophosphokinase